MTARYDDFSGQHILVTGAARGIGRVIAQNFVDQGGKVTALDLDFSNIEPIEGASLIQCDVTKDEILQDLINEAMRLKGPIKVLVNNAGVDRRMSLSEQTGADFRWMLDVNLTHHAILAQIVAPGMEKLGGGAIVNMTSTAWMKRAHSLTAYHAAKAAIVGLTNGLARDLGPKNIRANAIAPGRVPVERTSVVDDPTWIAQTHAMQCIPQLLAPQDIADAALWLASSSARMITGQVITVDGGGVGIFPNVPRADL